MIIKPNWPKSRRDGTGKCIIFGASALLVGILIAKGIPVSHHPWNHNHYMMHSDRLTDQQLHELTQRDDFIYISTFFFITSGTTFNIPIDFKSLTFIDAIGAGGAGGISSGLAGSGGGGGAWGRITSLSGIEWGVSFTCQIGTSVVGGTTGSGTTPTRNTWLVNVSTLVAAGGSNGANSSTVGVGGTVANSVGAGGTHAGGNGGAPWTSGATAGGGGGGAGGPTGAGVTGTSATSSTVGGNGGNGDVSSGGAGGTSSGLGGNGTEYDATHGSGGGGGAGSFSASGGAGGRYGGGGGGTSDVTQHLGAAGLLAMSYISRSLSQSISINQSIKRASSW
jgi:hypothetical protein